MYSLPRRIMVLHFTSDSFSDFNKNVISKITILRKLEFTLAAVQPGYRCYKFRKISVFALTLLKIKTMEINWTVLGIVAFCAIILIVYLFRENLKDKKEVTKFFNEEIKTKKNVESDDEL